jgi:hypothetical protein
MAMMKLMAKVMAPTVIVLAIGIAAPPVLGAQAKLADPDVAALRAAKNEVFVQLASTPVEIHGRLTVFDATALTMEVDGRSFTFPSDEVLRIDTIGGFNRDKGVAGALIGGLVGGALCALVCGQGLDSRGSLAAVAIGNGGIGAAIGGLIGITRDGHKTIYKSAGSGAAISRRPDELPCPATPLVLEADMSAIDLRTLPQTWTPVPQSQGFGASRCDGVTIRRQYNGRTDAWQPGVEIAAGPVDAVSIDVRVRVTVRYPKDRLDKQAHVNVALWQDGRSQVTAVASIDAGADEESRGDACLRVPRALLSPSPSGLSLQVTLTTSYPR